MQRRRDLLQDWQKVHKRTDLAPKGGHLLLHADTFQVAEQKVNTVDGRSRTGIQQKLENRTNDGANCGTATSTLTKEQVGRQDTKKRLKEVSKYTIERVWDGTAGRSEKDKGKGALKKRKKSIHSSVRPRQPEDGFPSDMIKTGSRRDEGKRQAKGG